MKVRLGDSKVEINKGFSFDEFVPAHTGKIEIFCKCGPRSPNKVCRDLPPRLGEGSYNSRP
eukprot:6229637-Heterocapsa_arctica.AAC.1